MKVFPVFKCRRQVAAKVDSVKCTIVNSRALFIHKSEEAGISHVPVRRTGVVLLGGFLSCQRCVKRMLIIVPSAMFYPEEQKCWTERDCLSSKGET